MNDNWWSLDISQLKVLYEQEYMAFQAALLDGVSWEDLIEQRKRMTEISIALHRKNQAGTFSHPLEPSSGEPVE